MPPSGSCDKILREMSFWERLSKYRTHGPQAVGEIALQPSGVFRRILGEVADEVLLCLCP